MIFATTGNVSSDNCELPRPRTSMLPAQWCLHAAAFYDRLTQNVLVSGCTQLLGCQSAVAGSYPMLQITADVPMSDIIIGLTLVLMAGVRECILADCTFSNMLAAGLV